MTKKKFTEKYKESLEEALWKAEIEVKFLEEELGKIEDEINKSSGIIYPTMKDGRKTLENLQIEKRQIDLQINRESQIAYTLSTKLQFLNSL
ncbi:MAG: hypothetical protein ACR2N3_04745 [Pyrinomonadaceae bacterium]